MTLLNKTPFVILISVGTKANIIKPTAYGWQGELVLATDTNHLYFFPTTEGAALPVQTLDMAAIYEGDVQTYDDAIVFVG